MGQRASGDVDVGDRGGPLIMDDAATAIRGAAAGAGEDLGACLDLARTWGRRIPLPAEGSTGQRLRMLAAAAAGDLTAARVLEPHVDALAILAEAGSPDPVSRPPFDGPAGHHPVWGVFAAEAPSARLEAHRTESGWVLDGTKPWCSLAGILDAALVTAHTNAGRALFAVDLHDPRVHARPGSWVARGLRRVDSGPVDFHEVPAEAVGAPGWYLERAGFAWGAVGVAACWYGGSLALVEQLRTNLGRRRDPDRVLALNFGRADAALFAAASCLEIAAAVMDSGNAAGQAGALLAARVRAVVVTAAEGVLSDVGHALGPAPLAFDEAYARRTADLGIYLRQHHGDRDLAELGLQVLAGGGQ